LVRAKLDVPSLEAHPADPDGCFWAIWAATLTGWNWPVADLDGSDRMPSSIKLWIARLGSTICSAQASEGADGAITAARSRVWKRCCRPMIRRSGGGTTITSSRAFAKPACLKR